MTRISTPAEAWVLVCDGSKAIFYRNVSSIRHVRLIARHTLEEHHPPTRDLGSDRPGRSYDSHDSSRSAVASPDWHQEAETKFLKAVATKLEEIVNTEGGSALLILAAPRALGVLRDNLGPTSRQLLKAELARDLVKMPKHKVEAYLEKIAELA